MGFHRVVIRHAGAQVVPIPVDGGGARTGLLSTADFEAVRAVVVTPAHQYPTGVTLQPQRRACRVRYRRRRDLLISKLGLPSG